jgi:hypothetical protein
VGSASALGTSFIDGVIAPRQRLVIDCGIDVIAHGTGVIDHALQSITGVIAYGVRVSAYGISHRRTYRARQRLVIDHGIGVIAHGTSVIDHGQQ